MENEIARIAEKVEACCGIYIKDSNTYNFRKVVERTLVHHPPNTPVPESLLLEIAGNLIIQETFFFRQPQFLEYITEQIRAQSGQTSILSVGASTGEEIYTVAMYLENKSLVQKAQLYGIDLSRRAIEHARQGVYNRYKLRNTDSEYLKYFEKRKDFYYLKEEIKSTVTFNQLNLLKAEELQKMKKIHFDIVLARNIFIYFRDKLPGILSNINSLIKPEGILITTPVEYEKVIKANRNNIKIISI